MSTQKSSLINKYCQICKVCFGTQRWPTKPPSTLIFTIISLNKKIICLWKFCWGTSKSVERLWSQTVGKFWRKKKGILTAKRNFPNHFEKCQSCTWKKMSTLVVKSLLLSIFTCLRIWKQSGTANTLKSTFRKRYLTSSKDGCWEWVGTASIPAKESLSFELIFKFVFKFC